MKSSDDPELVPAPNQFATGDMAEGHHLRWRIIACFSCRIPDLCGVHVTVVGNTAVLRGKVRSLHEKRLCLECCRHVPGVMRVVDELIVADEKLVNVDPEEGQS